MLSFSLLLVLGTTVAFAGNCTAIGEKCGLPIVTFQNEASTTAIFSAVRSTNPVLYAGDAQYHVFYDSRTSKAIFQDANGVAVTPDSNARLFIITWHDGVGTDWRYIDAALATRIPATAKADQLAHIAWAIKSATLTPGIILVGGNQDLAFAKLYVAGLAAPQFRAESYRYNNDLRGVFATDAAESTEAPALNAAGISALMLNSATDQYGSRNALLSATAVKIVDGIAFGKSAVAGSPTMQFTSRMGSVVWSVLEGPSAGTIDRNGLFTLTAREGSVHVVAVSRANHTLVAVAPVPVSTPLVTTDDESLITAAGATFNATVNPVGATGVAGFEYATNSSFSPASDTTSVPLSGSVMTPVSIAQANLTAATQYYVRAFFRDGTSNVVTFGAAMTFTTSNTFAETTNASAGTSSGATLNGFYNDGGLAGFVFFEYSLDNFVHKTQTPHVAVAGDFTTHAMSAVLTTLKTATAYQFKAYFLPSVTGAVTQIGAAKAFSTEGIFAEDDEPNWSINIGKNSVTFPGKYGTGGAAARVWVETSTSPTFAGGGTVRGPFDVAAGTYAYQPSSITVTTLTKGTTYYFRYVIRNTDNGDTYRYPYTRSFTTLQTTAISLSSSFNREGIVTDGTNFPGGIANAYDGGCCSMSSNLLGAGTTFKGTAYTYGAANTANVIYGAGQTITLPPGNWTTFKFLGSGVNGNQSGTFIANYSDGTSDTFTQGISDWFTPQNYTGEQKAVTMAYRDLNGGGQDNRTFYLYAYSFALNNTKTLKSITLPNNSNINVVAITLVP